MIFGGGFTQQTDKETMIDGWHSIIKDNGCIFYNNSLFFSGGEGGYGRYDDFSFLCVDKWENIVTL